MFQPVACMCVCFSRLKNKETARYADLVVVVVPVEEDDDECKHHTEFRLKLPTTTSAGQSSPSSVVRPVGRLVCASSDYLRGATNDSTSQRRDGQEMQATHGRLMAATN